MGYVGGRNRSRGGINATIYTKGRQLVPWFVSAGEGSGEERLDHGRLAYNKEVGEKKGKEDGGRKSVGLPTSMTDRLSLRKIGKEFLNSGLFGSGARYLETREDRRVVQGLHP